MEQLNSNTNEWRSQELANKKTKAETEYATIANCNYVFYASSYDADETWLGFGIYLQYHIWVEKEEQKVAMTLLSNY